MNPAAVLRHALTRPGILVAPGAYDALTARLIEEAGFAAVYLTGSGVAYTSLAAPDLGLVSGADMVRKVWEIAGAVGLPVIADGDTGYGNALNVRRTVREYERAGAAAIQLEDQVFPKKCGHYDNKVVITAGEMAAKIKAACDARVDSDFVIVARTDARDPLGLEEALRRANLYAQAGADVVFVEAPRSVEEMRQITAAVDRPCLANMVEGGKTPLLSAAELQQIGYRLVIFPNSLTRAVVRIAREVLTAIRRDGTTAAIRDRMVDFHELQRTVGLEHALELEARYRS